MKEVSLTWQEKMDKTEQIQVTIVIYHIIASFHANSKIKNLKINFSFVGPLIDN